VEASVGNKRQQEATRVASKFKIKTKRGGSMRGDEGGEQEENPTVGVSAGIGGCDVMVSKVK